MCITFSVLIIAGHFGLRLCTEGAAEAAAEALQPADPGGRQPHPEPVEVLRRRQELRVKGHLEDSHQGAGSDDEQRVEGGKVVEAWFSS